MQRFSILGFGRVVGPGVFLFGLPSQRQRRKLRILLAIAWLATSLGCGGGGGSGGSQPIPGTPAGTYNIIVTATSSGLSHTTTFAVTVQ